MGARTGCRRGKHQLVEVGGPCAGSNSRGVDLSRPSQACRNSSWRCHVMAPRQTRPKLPIISYYIELFHCLRCLTRIHYISSKALGMTRLRGLFVIVSFFIHRIPLMFHCVAALATADLACLAQLGHTRNRSKLQVFQCSLRVVAVREGLPKKLYNLRHRLQRIPKAEDLREPYSNKE